MPSKASVQLPIGAPDAHDGQRTGRDRAGVAVRLPLRPWGARGARGECLTRGDGDLGHAGRAPNVHPQGDEIAPTAGRRPSTTRRSPRRARRARTAGSAGRAFPAAADRTPVRLGLADRGEPLSSLWATPPPITISDGLKKFTTLASIRPTRRPADWSSATATASPNDAARETSSAVTVPCWSRAVMSRSLRPSRAAAIPDRARAAPPQCLEAADVPAATTTEAGSTTWI